MSTVVILDQSELEVLPGEEASCGLRIRNDGTIVESYTFEVLGDAAGWISTEPDTLSIYPGTEGYATVRFRPPRSAAIVAGDVPFGVRVTPLERPADQSVVEGVVRVLPFADTTAELTPRTSTGRRGGRHELAVDNRGNSPLNVNLTGADPDRRLSVSVRPATLSIEPGQAAFATVRARPRRLRWRGQAVTFPFEVRVEPEDTEPVALDGATVQLPVVPNGAARILAAVLALLLIGAGLWFAVLRPAVRSTAEEAANNRVEPAVQKVEEANKSAQQAAQDAAAAAGKPTPTPTPTPKPKTTPTPKPKTTPTPTGKATPTPATQAGSGALPPGATSLTRRLETAHGRGTSDTDQYTVPAGKISVVTDLFLQNPQGDEGRLDLTVNNQTLITVSLANFRDLDYHLVSPIEVTAGQKVGIRTTCTNPGKTLAGAGGGSQCRVFALLGGYNRPAPSPTPSQ